MVTKQEVEKMDLLLIVCMVQYQVRYDCECFSSFQYGTASSFFDEGGSF